MATQAFNVEVSFVDKFSAGIKNFSGQLDSMSKKIQSMEPTFTKMRNVGGAAFLGIVGAIGLSIRAAQEQEVAYARLDQIAKQVTKSTEAEIDGFKALASQLQSVGVIGDDVIAAGQSQVASFTKSSAVVSELSDDLADLAVAQYGVNVNQEQAIQTGNLLGKALQGQLGALTRTGILVNDEFRAAFEAANTEQERAIILSQIIQDNYGGLNASLRETSAGGLAALKNSLGDISESLGSAFLPALATLAEKLVPIVDKIAIWAEENPKMVIGIVAVTGGLAALTFALGAAGLAFIAINPLVTMFGVQLGLIAGPIGWLGLAVAALVVLLATHWQEIQESLDIFVDGVIAKFQWLWDNLGNIGKIGLDLLLGHFGSAWAGIKDLFNINAESISNMFTAFLNLIIGKINKFIEKMNQKAAIISSIPGVPNIPTIPKIPLLAEGGIVTRPTLAMVGEGGEPEAVIPLSKMGKMGGGQTIVNNFYGTINGDRIAFERMADEVIMKKLKMNLAI